MRSRARILRGIDHGIRLRICCRQDGVVSELGNRSAADFVFIEDRPRGMELLEIRQRRGASDFLRDTVASLRVKRVYRVSWIVRDLFENYTKRVA